MPNIAFKPRPNVDPYAGKAGEILGELFATISQIHTLRQQRNQSNAILDIMKSDMTDEEKRLGIINVARNGGDVMRNMIARSYLAESLTSSREKELEQARLENVQARTKYYKAQAEQKESGIDINKLNTELSMLDKLYENSEPGSKEETGYKSRIDEIGQILRSQQVKPSAPAGQPALSPVNAGVDAVTMAAPVTGRPPQQTKVDAAIAKEIDKTGPPTAPGFINQNWFRGMGPQPGEFAQPGAATQAEPATQEDFEQMVSQMAKTDRAAAKAYYDTWVKKWQ